MQPIQHKTTDIVVPVYNGELFIANTLKSIESQTIKPSKIIIVDDGSTDSTKDIIDDFKKNSQIEIKYIYQENRGLSSARNVGIKSSTSEFIAFLDADDVWLPEKLFTQMEIFNNSEYKPSAVYGDYLLIDYKGENIDENNRHINPVVKGNIFNLILDANLIVGSASSILIKREVFDDIGYFDENLKAFEDWDMWLRIARKYNFDFSSEKVVRIRKHQNNMQKNYVHMLENEIKFYNKWEKEIEENEIPLKWRNNIMTLVFLTFPFIQSLIYTRNHLSKRLYKSYFSKYGGIEIYTLIKIIQKLWKKI